MERIPVDAYVIDTLMRDLVGHDRKPSAFIVYLYLWRRTAATRREGVHASHQEIADATGLSKSAVQTAIRVLTRRRLVRVQRAFRTATPHYVLERHWRE